MEKPVFSLLFSMIGLLYACSVDVTAQPSWNIAMKIIMGYNTRNSMCPVQQDAIYWGQELTLYMLYKNQESVSSTQEQGNNYCIHDTECSQLQEEKYLLFYNAKVYDNNNLCLFNEFQWVNRICLLILMVYLCSRRGKPDSTNTHDFVIHTQYRG